MQRIKWTTSSMSKRIILYGADAVYLTLLAFILFLHGPFRPGLAHFGMSLWSKQHLASVNLIPFHSIVKVFTDIRDHLIRVDTGVMNIGVNLALLLPYGILLPLTIPKIRRTPGKMRMAAILTASGIEILQFFTMTGWTDVDDVVMNTVGAMIGFRMLRYVQSCIRVTKGNLDTYREGKQE